MNEYQINPWHTHINLCIDYIHLLLLRLLVFLFLASLFLKSYFNIISFAQVLLLGTTQPKPQCKITLLPCIKFFVCLFVYVKSQADLL